MIRQEQVVRLMVIVLMITLVVGIVICLRLAWVSGDAPYYLAIARDLSDGKVLYRDVICDYTPLVIASFSVIYYLLGDAPYSVMLGYQMMIILFGGAILFCIFRRTGYDRKISLIGSAGFVIATLSSDGNYINLEVFSMLFVLAAMYMAMIGDKYFVAGLLLGCSFLCKQYGVLNFVPFGLYVLMSHSGPKARAMRVAALSLGGLIVFFSFLGYYTLLKDVELNVLWRQITNANYVDHVVNRQRSLVSLLIGAKVFLILLLPLIFFAWRSRARTSVALMVFVFTGIAVGLIPVYYQGFQHYYLNTFPYLFIGLLHVYFYSDSKVSFHATFFSAILIVSVFLIARVIRYEDVRKKQSEVAAVVSFKVPPGSQAFLDTKVRFLYVLNSYRNPYSSSIGYDYTFTRLDTLLDSSTQSVIISTSEFSERPRTTLATPIGAVHIYQSVASR